MKTFKGNYSHIQLKEFNIFEINKTRFYVLLKAFDNKKITQEKNLKYLSNVLTDKDHDYTISWVAKRILTLISKEAVQQKI